MTPTNAVLLEALEQIAGNNWKDQSRARHVAREAIARVKAAADMKKDKAA